jgi:hydroxymethylpyrimidine/phosphomethylpyrimidine kinase
LRRSEGGGLIARVLSIAGSDSGGGAGIQADLKTITMLGAFGASAVTAVTVQNTLGVAGVHSVPPDIVAAQITAVLSDIGADAIKIGMLGDAPTIRAVSLALEGQPMPIVLDPVMVAKGGARLLDAAALSALEPLLARACLVTPNVPELEVLIGRAIATPRQLRDGALALAQRVPAVLAKGGHLEGPAIVDWLAAGDHVAAFSGPRIATRHSHGTGCTLSSAIAVGLAQGMALAPAIERARRFVTSALAAAPGLGRGHGPMGHQAVTGFGSCGADA